MTVRSKFYAAIAGLVLLPFPALAQDTGAPPTRVQVVTDSIQGVTIRDPYRWLENGADPAVHDWSVAQDKRTRAYLDALPVRAKLHDRLTKLISATSSSYYDLKSVGTHVFALYNQPPKQQPMIAVLGNDAEPDTARIVVDPNELNEKGTTAIDWYEPSPDGSLVAVSLSENGSEVGAVHVFDVSSGHEVGEVVPRVQNPTGGGSLAWASDGKGFWYTRYPGDERPEDDRQFYQQIFFHMLDSDPAKDAYVLGKDFPKVAEIALDNHQSSGAVLASVANGDGGEFAQYVLTPDGKSTQVSRFEDKIVAGAIGPDNMLYLVSRKDAPRGKLLKLPLSDLTLAHAKMIVPPSDAVLQGGGEFGGRPVVVTRDQLYVREMIGGPSQVAIFDHDGKPTGKLPLPDVADVREVEALSDGSLLYSIATYLRPPYFMRYDEAAGWSTETRLVQTSPVDFDDAEVVRAFATSKDGTKIPLNIVRRKNTALDGSNPVLLYGYGGYSISLTPRFLGATTRMWLDGGGVYVIANLRGGGEYGEQWHAQGSLTRKQNVFDDFLGAARYLIKERYTTSDHLAIQGGSNGGLLMGAAFTQAPSLFRAVVAQVGIYDMLRSELEPNGAFNVTEFGTVKDKAQFNALYAYSPYHHVKKGTKYPAIFMATGEHDGRVDPMQSRKMIAALQASTGSGRPVYLSINDHAGHGIGSALSIRIDQYADYQSFLFDQLGMTLPD